MSDKGMPKTVDDRMRIAEALAGKDNFWVNYFKAFRAGMFEA
jgi:hypothetical protein